MFRKLKQRIVPRREKSTNKKSNHDARPSSQASVRARTSFQNASPSPRKAKKLRRKGMSRDRKGIELVEKGLKRDVDESDSDVFETASEGEEGDDDDEDTILAGQDSARNKDADNDDIGDNTLIENDDKPTSQETTTTNLPQETHQPALSKFSSPPPLLTSTAKSHVPSILTRLNTRLQTLTLSLNQCQDLILHLTTLNARLDSLAARHKRAELLIQMFTEEPEKLTEEYRVYIKEEVEKIGMLDRDVYEEVERVRGQGVMDE